MDPQLSLTFCFPRCLLVRKGNDIETTVYGKPTHNDIYLHWNLFALNYVNEEHLKHYFYIPT